MRLLVSIAFLFIGTVAFAQQPNELVRQGNSLYHNGDYASSQEKYNQSLQLEPSHNEAAFNLGNAMYRKSEFEEAAQQYETLASGMTDKSKKSDAYHNLGNAYLQQQQYEKSINAYKNALYNDPTNDDARYNLTYAKKMLKKQQQEQQEQDKEGDENEENKDDGEENKDENGDPNDENKDQNEDGEGDNEEDKKDPNEGNEEEDKKDGDGENEEQNQEPQQGQPENQVSKQNAARMLDALNEMERADQEGLKKEKVKGAGAGIVKDW